MATQRSGRRRTGALPLSHAPPSPVAPHARPMFRRAQPVCRHNSAASRHVRRTIARLSHHPSSRSPVCTILRRARVDRCPHPGRSGPGRAGAGGRGQASLSPRSARRRHECRRRWRIHDTPLPLRRAPPPGRLTQRLSATSLAAAAPQPPPPACLSLGHAIAARPYGRRPATHPGAAKNTGAALSPG